ERIRLAVEIQARQLGEAQPVVALVEDRVGLGSDDLHAVPEAGEFAGEMTYVDALPATERVSLVGQECDAQRAQAVGGRAREGPGLTGLSGHPGPPSPCTVPRDYDGTLT